MNSEEPLVLFWAKLGKETWPERYHPVLCHLVDVGQVVRGLWDHVLRARVREWVAAKLGLADEEAVGSWLAFWSAAHDIGKVSPCFQMQGNTEALRRRLEESGFDVFGEVKAHGDISTKVLADELESRGRPWPAIPKKTAQNVAIAVGGHHGVLSTTWFDIHSPLGSDRWGAARREILAELARLFGVTEIAPPCRAIIDDQSVWMFIAGLTSVADWIGSNQEFFKPAGSAALVNGPFDVDDYFANANGWAARALQELGWLGRPDATDPVTFTELFQLEPRPLQKETAATVAGMDKPTLLIVEAPMGEGKTEAAWYAAACWDRRHGQGVYVALPTMATSNQMFTRVESFLFSDGGEGKKNLMLQHGKAALNDRFEKLKYAAQTYDDEKRPSAVVAEGWFAANKKHGLLAPYGVGTVDQALLAVLQTKHVFVRLFGLTGKCVILDEVHAYDAYMTTLLERLLRWLAALGCPVLVLSATLPRDKRVKLLRAYAGASSSEPEHVEYPRITSVSVGSPITVKHVKADKERARTVQLAWLNEEDLADHLRVSLVSGGCAAVIRNTVGLAQDTYLRLRESLKGEGIAVELFHARFPFGRRKQIEDETIKSYGKTRDDLLDDQGCIVSAPHRPTKSILVATQVVEQSLDLDFDVMISDVAPVDLVLQRTGRLHRHKRGPRPKGVNEPRLWLIEPAVKGGLPDFGHSEYVYARFILLRSLLALRALDPPVIELPDHLEALVEQVYGGKQQALPDDWQAALNETARELEAERSAQRMKAKGLMIYRPDDADLLAQQNGQLDEENPEAAETIRAATRDTEPTIHVVLVHNIDGVDYLDVSGREPFSETDEPNIEQVRRLLDNEVAINHRGCVSFYAHRPVPTGWRERGMLRHHRVLRIDASGASLSTEYPLLFDTDVGVCFHGTLKKEGS